MGLFDGKEKQELEIIKDLVHIVDRLTREKHTPNRVHLTLNIKSPNQILQIMALSIASNQKVLGTLALVDAVTNGAVTGSFSAVSATSDTAAAFTASVDADNDVVVTGIAAGSGVLTVVATAAFTDSTGVSQTQSLSVGIPVTITAVVTADQVNLVVNFGNPTAQ